MAVSELQDGQPLTFEWLNSLVKEINTINSSVNFLKSVDSIDIVGVSTSNLQIEVGTAKVNKKSNDEAVEIIAFQKAFKVAPVVVATVDQKKPSSVNPISAVVSVTGITASGFRCGVMLTNDSSTWGSTIKEVGITYIAIGDRA